MKIIYFLFFIYLTISVNAQNDRGQPCLLLNPHLITELEKGTITGIVLSSASSYGAMASSTLEPTGENPDQIEEASSPDQTVEEMDIAEIQSINAGQDWMCQYSANNVGDSDLSTAWAEGVDGDGIGEVVISGVIDITKPVKILAGYGKSILFLKRTTGQLKQMSTCWVQIVYRHLKRLNTINHSRWPV